MSRRKTFIVLSFLVLLLIPTPARALMDCYPGINTYTPTVPYPICLIDHEAECLYCIVSKPGVPEIKVPQ
jgi:hypothetical protein